MVGIEEILALEHLEKDIFRGAVHPTALQRTFGGNTACLKVLVSFPPY